LIKRAKVDSAKSVAFNVLKNDCRVGIRERDSFVQKGLVVRTVSDQVRRSSERMEGMGNF